MKRVESKGDLVHIIAPHQEHVATFQDEKKEIHAKQLTIVVIGASGDLAKKKTFPALYRLFRRQLLPPDVAIWGYARSKLTKEALVAKFRPHLSGDEKVINAFISRVSYHSGQYDSADDFTALDTKLKADEGAEGGNRVFYLAIPPTLFAQVGQGVQPAAMSTTGWNRVVVEKPFGHDLESSEVLGNQLAALFDEEQIFRIDHYLGKEMVQNLLVLRFSNTIWEPLWNRHWISNVQITFKENFGTKGRAGYFDTFGIIRDVMQNHLLQMVSLVAMEAPTSLSAEDIRNEKVKLLRSIPPIVLEDMVLGQYGPAPDGSEPAYLDDPQVPSGSVTPTYAAAIVHINNDRWSGVPFILKCGKALNERKAEIRIQFRSPANHLFSSTSPNELVLRVQPDEAVYCKMSTKRPGLEGGAVHTEMDLSYASRFPDEAKDLPDAYDRLIYDVIRGDHSLFVRADELKAAWEIFTPVLHQIENDRVKPDTYEFGSRGPAAATALIQRAGYIRTTGYSWRSPATSVSN
jgi:glucose-6-phosphate 1-dehydrogenase